MEPKSHIKFIHNVSSLIISLCLIIITLSFVPSLTVHADDYTSWAKTLVDSMGSDNSSSNKYTQNGVNWQRTGYLCYMLTVDGDTVPGTQAKAFSSPGFSSIGGAWKCTPKKGGYSSPTSWTAPAPWNLTPWEEGGVTNEPGIKAWMEEPNPRGFANASDFVERYFGADAYRGFDNHEYVLVIETIMNFQYSLSESTSTISKSEAQKLAMKAIKNRYGTTRALAFAAKKNGCTTQYAQWEHEGCPTSWDNQSIAMLMSELSGRMADIYIQENSSDHKLVGEPVIGTLHRLIEYKESIGYPNTRLDSYVNKIALFAEMITQGNAGERAGFKPWTGSRSMKISNSEAMAHGLAMLVVEAEKQGVIHTWDSPLNEPGPAPDHPFKTIPPQLSIVKNYRTKNMETGEIISDDGCFIRRDVVPDISIDDEPEYKVVGWKVSTTTQDNIDSIDWNPPGNISKNGLTSGSTKLEEKQNEYCLYVLLEKTDEETPEEEDYNYLLPQSRITRRIWLSTPENPLSEKIDEHEFIWRIEEHIHECAGHDCDGLNAFHSCDGHEKEISETETTTEYCSTGCKDEAHDDYCDDRSGVSKWKFIERNLKLSIYNSEKENFPDIVSSKKEWTENTGEVKPINGLMKSFYKNGSFDRGNDEYDYTAKEYKETGWDYICVIHRGQDDLTLLEYKNDSLGASDANTELADVSPKSYKVADTDSGTRKTGDYYEAFNATFELDTKTAGIDNETTFSPVDKSPHVGGICAKDLKTIILDPLSINDIRVKVEVYSGLPGGGQNDITPNLPQRGNESYNYKGTTYDAGRRVKIETGGSVSFRPYIQMQYDTILNIDKKAYVTGEYQRSITTNDYAEIGYNSGTGGILTLSSLQWSTHKSSQGNGKVLPGGAALSLSIDTGNHRFVRISTFQCFVDGAGKEQIDRMGGDYSALQTQSEAKGSHDSLVASVKAALEVLNVQQWVNKNGGDPFGGIPVDNYENTDISALDNNAKDGKVSMDAKYYFSNDGGNTLAGEGDLDVEIAGRDSEIIYTFFTNTKGEVRVVKDDVNAPLTNEEAGTVLCTITKDMESWSYGNTFTGGSNLVADAAYINQRTNVVDKLIKGVEAGTGRDTGVGMTNAPGWRNPEWYNEAFDGISVVVNSTVLEVGYKYPSERQIVLDPKLIPYQKNQAGMATNLTFTSGFKTKPYSPAYSSAPGQIGTFRGARIDLADMDTFFKTSESFHILNQTTQDLH